MLKLTWSQKPGVRIQRSVDSKNWTGNQKLEPNIHNKVALSLHRLDHRTSWGQVSLPREKIFSLTSAHKDTKWDLQDVVLGSTEPYICHFQPRNNNFSHVIGWAVLPTLWYFPLWFVVSCSHLYLLSYILWVTNMKMFSQGLPPSLLHHS